MDSLSNMLVSIKNASMRFKEKVDVNYSKMNAMVLEILKSEGFISGYKIIKDEKTNRQVIRVNLKYTEDKTPVFAGFKRISKPSRRIYRGYDEFPRLKNSFGINIVSTPKGVMSSINAKKERLGGEVICQVW
ncbi:MAG: 30S ribosomal protein S8 [Elusimicrobiales bacterium]|nr:30S ribosomal protein S8 [Elusimicrobiales bacterium]HOJ85924.1 30S ribosomal protein S8 [Elusimicrobiales bacterium]HOL61873.1 30S ribosomal protein S8 [Elusimicrobiales bacterium]HPO95091.1 30S ribosomal protein S8 [Elusimicrobiales bacterium]